VRQKSYDFCAAQNTAGGEYNEYATRLLTGGPPAVFDRQHSLRVICNVFFLELSSIL